MISTRRGLLAGAGAHGASLAVGRSALARVLDSRSEPFPISLAQWSLHRALRSGELDPLDFPRVARTDFGIGAVEYVSTFYRGKATDFGYLQQLKDACAQHSVESLLIMVDGEGNLGDLDPSRRRTAVENHFKWIAAASFLGCHSIRVNAGGQGAPEVLAANAADSLARLGAMGDAYDVNVIVENHGGLSSNGAWLAGVIQAASERSKRVGTLPDFGNFQTAQGVWYDRYQGVEELMPFARAVSAKSHDFDAEGNETHTDYRRMLTIVRDAGYRGWIGIEYEGGALSEPEGIRRTKALIERVRKELF